MKRLIVMRHATTEPSSPGGDAERPLTAAGHAEAARVGRWLVSRGYSPDLALCSTARRVHETWVEVEKAFDSPPTARFDRALYMATAHDLLLEASEVGDDVSAVILVAHNPAVSHLAFELTEHADPDGRERLRRGFRPATTAVFEGVGDAFGDLPEMGARLVDFVAVDELE